MLLHLFELFLDSDKTDGDIPGCDSHDLADFLIAEVFQPEQDDGAVERAQLADALPQQAELAGVLGLLVEQVDVYRQGFGPQAALLFPVLGDTSVEGDFPNPGIQRAVPSEGSGAPPKVDQDFLEEVGHLVLVGREHVAHGVNRASVFSHQGFKFTFCHGRLACFCSLDADSAEKLQCEDTKIAYLRREITQR